MPTYATLADIQARHPRDIVLLAADEDTGVLDAGRVAGALEAADADINGILFARYTTAELARLDAASRAIVKTYAIDIALYRVALSFARSSERLEEQFDAAIARLTAIAKGAGGLTFNAGDGDDDGPGAGGASLSPNEAVVEAPERLFTRERMRGW
jgi:phage gp36-like protein